MACPWFTPLERLPASRAAFPAPLGDAWTGQCHAREEAWLPDRDTLRLCNFGYARESCPRVPGDGPDAVRFCVSCDREGLISIRWVAEKDYLPFEHGRLEYSRVEARFRPADAEDRIRRQAQAYVRSYLRAKGEA
jgi:hypothetical protein